jgi:hypothetical protein
MHFLDQPRPYKLNTNLIQDEAFSGVSKGVEIDVGIPKARGKLGARAFARLVRRWFGCSRRELDVGRLDGCCVPKSRGPNETIVSH